MKNTKTELERISDKFGTKNTKNGLALTSDKLGNGWDILHWIASGFVNASLECFVAGPRYFNTEESVKGCARRLYYRIINFLGYLEVYVFPDQTCIHSRLGGYRPLEDHIREYIKDHSKLLTMVDQRYTTDYQDDGLSPKAYLDLVVLEVVKMIEDRIVADNKAKEVKEKQKKMSKKALLWEKYGL